MRYRFSLPKAQTNSINLIHNSIHNIMTKSMSVALEAKKSNPNNFVFARAEVNEIYATICGEKVRIGGYNIVNSLYAAYLRIDGFDYALRDDKGGVAIFQTLASAVEAAVRAYAAAKVLAYVFEVAAPILELLEAEHAAQKPAQIFGIVEELHDCAQFERGKMQRQMSRELHAISTAYNSTQAAFAKKIAELEAKEKALDALLLKIADGAPLDIKFVLETIKKYGGVNEQ